MTLHFIIVFESKKETGKFMITTDTLTGDDIVERMKCGIEVTCRSWYEDWKLISVSHSFLERTVTRQL